jgi:hypothetical protein
LAGHRSNPIVGQRHGLEALGVHGLIVKNL